MRNNPTCAVAVLSCMNMGQSWVEKQTPTREEHLWQVAATKIPTHNSTLG
ncbi:MAG: hypothetical protein ABIJ30_05020 [bacterium]